MELAFVCLKLLMYFCHTFYAEKVTHIVFLLSTNLELCLLPSKAKLGLDDCL